MNEFFFWLASLPIWIQGVLMFGFIYFLAGLAFMFSRGIIATPWFKPVQTPMMQVVGMIFALLVAFLATHVWKDVNDARASVKTETHSLEKVLLFSSILPAMEDLEIRRLVGTYCRLVAEEEWKVMSTGKPNPRSEEAIRHLMIYVKTMKADSDQLRLVQASLIAAINETLSARYDRLHISQDTIPFFTWLTLFFLAFLVFLTIALVHYDKPQSQGLALIIHASMTASILLLIFAYDQPFVHKMIIGPKNYIELAQRILGR